MTGQYCSAAKLLYVVLKQLTDAPKKSVSQNKL